MTNDSIIRTGVDIDPQNLPTGETKRTAIRSLFDTIAPRYDIVNRIMTLGFDVRFRRRTLEELELPAGSRVLDLACGTGDFCRELAGAGMLPIGFDLSMGMLASARTDAQLVHADILALPLDAASADGVVCGYALRNLVELPGFFDEVARVVRPGGRIAFLEVAEPDNAILARGHRIYFEHVMPRIGAAFSDATAYQYLPKSVAYLPDQAVMTGQIRAAGFGEVRRSMPFGGISQIWTATRR